MKKIVIASDSFKGSLTSAEVADAAERGIRSVFPECEVRKVLIADGGEGTVEAIVGSCGGEYRTVTVFDPLMRPVEARYGMTGGGRTAVIEVAAASGLTLLSPSERNPMKTTTYGTGQLILDALNRGCRDFLVGLGGSATNDGGTGLLQALGFRFLDKQGKELGGGGEILSRIVHIDDSGVDPRVSQSRFTVACDVTNPFSGPDGAAYIFAPQKGASPGMIEELDEGLKNFAEAIHRFNGERIGAYPGAGAAGGLGGAFKAFLGAIPESGITLVLRAAGFAEMLGGCDLVVTGEGSLDGQTVRGKAPEGVMRVARQHGVPVVAIAGAVSGVEQLIREGFSAVFPVQAGPVSLEEALCSGTASENVRRTVEQIMNLLHIFDERRIR